VSLLQPEQRTLVNGSEMINELMMGKVYQEMVAVVWDALYDTTP
jgi:hypothetical protein